jgi:hypothetical protein
VRFFAMAYLGQPYGRQVLGFFSQFYRPALYALIALAIVSCIVIFGYFKWYKPWAHRNNRDRD